MDEYDRNVLTVESGIMCVENFGIFHEFAEKLLGHPVWTHEFAMPETALEMKIRILTEHKSERTVSPIETLAQIVPKEKILVAVAAAPSDSPTETSQQARSGKEGE